MGTYDEELVKDLKDIEKDVNVKEDPEPYLNLIEQKYEFDGSRIDWLQTNKHYSKKSNNELLLTDAKQFIAEIKDKYLSDDDQVLYIGDNLTEFAYQFEIKDIEMIIGYFLDILQHHYFIDLKGEWCICISYENYLDFGFSIKRN